MSLSRLLSAISATFLGCLGMATAAEAVEFGQQPIHPERVVAVASPIRGGDLYSLLILEQLGGRPCWQEQGSQPVNIDPLLLNFDFSGICDRKTDSNGYSLRVAGTDLGLAYRLEIDRRPNDLVLQAVPVDGGVPPIEIGRTHGIPADFAKIQLDPGWRITRRTYNNQAVSHLYLSHDQPLQMPLASVPTAPPAESSPPVIPPRVETPAVTPPTASGGDHYRVVVTGGRHLLEQVRTVEPSAFPTIVDGQAVIQVGLFEQPQRAEQVRRSLVQAGLPVKVLPASAPAVASNPAVPDIPHGEVVVMIDPGHGGRDPGAIGIGGLQEKDINTTISRRIQQVLQQRGLTVVMTRSDDTYVSLEGRTDYAERVGADVFISIHANAISLDRPDVNGLETYYYDTGQRLAQVIHDNVLQRVSMGNRGVRQARFFVLRRTSMPAVLVETGFVTGRVDAARFRDPAAVTQIADAIAAGILSYLGR